MSLFITVQEEGQHIVLQLSKYGNDFSQWECIVDWIKLYIHQPNMYEVELDPEHVRIWLSYR